MLARSVQQSPLAPDKHALACIGRGCAEKARCVKYRRHVATIGQVWATFDLERLHFGGDCPSFEKLTRK